MEHNIDISALCSDNELSQFVLQHADDNVTNVALHKMLYSANIQQNIAFILRQIEGRQKAKIKLPSFYANQHICYPKRLSMEQCSSEITAKYKNSLIETCGCETMVDLTGGFGIDTYWLSRNMKKAYYVERDEELCKIAAWNFHQLGADNIEVVCDDAIHFLNTMQRVDLLFIDPARRDKSGRKMVHIVDCEPDVLLLWQQIENKSRMQLIKLSPMIDIKEVVESPIHPSAVYVVAVDNECKEVLTLSDKNYVGTTSIVASDVNHNELKIHSLSFTTADEQGAVPTFATHIKTYLYEPSVALLKAGAFCITSKYYEIEKLDNNSHFYTSDALVDDFLGRVWKVVNSGEKHNNLRYANVIVRNYPLTAEQLKKKMKLKDGSDDYIIGTKLRGKPIVIQAIRVR